MMRYFCFAALAAVLSLNFAACSRSQIAVASPAASSGVHRAATKKAGKNPAPLVDHVTIVLMENRSFDDIIGNSEAPYINRLANDNTLLTNSFAVTHPSEPNYLALYSGSTHGLRNDACPLEFPGPSLGGELVLAGKTIKGYMEDLPSAGSKLCGEELYARKHNPLIDFSDTPVLASVPYSLIASDLLTNSYPTVAFVVPNLRNDMHDGTIEMGDTWLAANLPPILAYDQTHKGLLILTWDEDDKGSGNHIPTIMAGPMLTRGSFGQRITHYSVLRTVTHLFGLPALNDAPPISGVMRKPPSR